MSANIENPIAHTSLLSAGIGGSVLLPERDREVDKQNILLQEKHIPEEILRRKHGDMGLPGLRLRPEASKRVRRERPLSPNLEQAIESSRSILELKDDWDDEGSPGYEEATWNRAVDFLKRNALIYRRNHGVWVEAPRILPGPDGSIDLHWKTPKSELLINVSFDPEKGAEFYGDDSGKEIIKGSLDTSKQNEWILMWLMR